MVGNLAIQNTQTKIYINAIFEVHGKCTSPQCGMRGRSIYATSAV